MRHVNQFDFAALSCCIGLLPLGYWTLLIAWGRGWRILGESMVKREGEGRREESVVTNKGEGGIRKLTASEGRRGS